MMIATPGGGDKYTDLSMYKLQVPDNKFLTFKTKTCDNMTVILLGENNTMVTIGGTNETTYMITKNDEVKVSFTMENTTDCNEYKQYWVRWDDDMIEVGEGSLGNQAGVVMWKDPEPSMVTGLAIFSGETSGSWMFPTPGILVCSLDVVVTRAKAYYLFLCLNVYCCKYLIILLPDRLG